MVVGSGRAGLILRAAPLYAGPLLGGWTSAPPMLFVALVAVFTVMQLPTGKVIERGTISPLRFLTLLALVQFVVVGADWGLGVLAALASGRLALPVWLPLALSGLGAVIWRASHSRDPQRAETLKFLDRAVDAIESRTTLGDAPEESDIDDNRDTEIDAATTQTIEALWNLPEDAPLARIDSIARQLESRTGASGFHALLSETGEGFRAVDLAMLRYLARPRVRADLIASCDLGFAVTLLLDSDEPEVLNELATLTATVLGENAPASELPPPDALEEKARTCEALVPLVGPVKEAYRKWRTGCG